MRAAYFPRRYLRGNLATAGNEGGLKMFRNRCGISTWNLAGTDSVNIFCWQSGISIDNKNILRHDATCYLIYIFFFNIFVRLCVISLIILINKEFVSRNTLWSN